MNKIDQQPDRESHAVGGGVDALAQGAPSLPGSQAITVENAALPSMELRSEHGTALQGVSSKTTSRRAWLRRGVAVASPVVASLVSAPVYGACLNLNPSGFVSQNTFDSRHPGQTVCAFLGPNFWIKDSRVRTGGVFEKNTFEKVFGTDVEAAISSAKPKPTLYDVLSGGMTYTDLAKYSIAAYLNASVNTANFPISAPQAKEIYHSYYPGPVKTPPLVAGWNVKQTESWLAMLMSRSF